MPRSTAIYQALTLFILLCGCAKENTAENNRPNVVLIVADDLGYSDLGSYGSEINTPVLDRMAGEGLRLANMHNAGMCVISRSSLLTGQWWPRVGYGIEKATNVAQELQANGYRTGLVGKWHLTGEPNKKGFDYFFGFLGGYASYFKGGPDYRLNEEKFEDFGDDFYSTDAFSERAVEFVEAEPATADQPFFLYLSYQAPHNPLQAPEEDIRKYRGKYKQGWEAVRTARIERQKQMGIIDADTPLPAYPQNLPDWNELSPEKQDLEDLRMSVYAAMVERMDSGIGRLMDALKAKNLADNTLVIFLSDNGTDSFSVMDAALLKNGKLPGDKGSNFQPGTGWAYACGTPRRLYKISQHGGGVKTGAIAWWPQQKLRAGAIVREPLHVVDISPTILELAKDEGKMPETNGDSTFAGTSFVPLLRGEEWTPTSPQYFQFMDNRAIRTEEWSLVEVDGNGWELYDNRRDPLETTDLAQQQPAKVAKLEKDWLAWWTAESGEAGYVPESTAESAHYKPQGDRGSGEVYRPSAMPAELKGRY